jgi:hypothetical protein
VEKKKDQNRGSDDAKEDNENLWDIIAEELKVETMSENEGNEENENPILENLWKKKLRLKEPNNFKETIKTKTDEESLIYC